MPGPFAGIVGVDIRPECRAFEEEQIAIRIGDQGNPKFLASLVKEFGPRTSSSMTAAI